MFGMPTLEGCLRGIKCQQRCEAINIKKLAITIVVEKNSDLHGSIDSQVKESRTAEREGNGN